MFLTSQTTFVVCLWMDFQNYHCSFYYKALTFVIGFLFATLMKTGTVSTDIIMWFFTLGEFVQSNESKHLIHSFTSNHSRTILCSTLEFRSIQLVCNIADFKISPANIVIRPSSLCIAAVLFTVFLSLSVLFAVS